MKWVYSFGDGKADGTAAMKNLLGGKGANLAEMSNLGLPVPPGFSITTEVCSYFYKHDQTYPAELRPAVEAALAEVGTMAQGRLGDAARPLLVSVRSGARVSMPGMMDTVLNLGLNAETTEGLAKLTDARFAYDSYRRFIQMYSDVVLGVEHSLFEEILDSEKEAKGVDLDTELNADDLKKIAGLTNGFEFLLVVETDVRVADAFRDFLEVRINRLRVRHLTLVVLEEAEERVAAVALEEALDSGRRHAHMDVLAHQLMRDAVVVPINLDVVIEGHRALAPLGIGVRGRRQ